MRSIEDAVPIDAALQCIYGTHRSMLELTIEGPLNVIFFPVICMIFFLCQSLALIAMKAHFPFMSGFILFFRPT